jgi:hypothetical protein
MTDPPCPTALPSILGPVVVELVDQVDDDNCCGSFHHDSRTIRVRRTMPPMVVRHTLYHEQMHLILNDAGISQTLTKKTEEAICDAYATYMVVTGKENP